VGSRASSKEGRGVAEGLAARDLSRCSVRSIMTSRFCDFRVEGPGEDSCSVCVWVGKRFVLCGWGVGFWGSVRSSTTSRFSACTRLTPLCGFRIHM
jgi:hypothetical protein